ncbi:hypothetical protein B1no1_17690 [Thermolongibacillus altinsuensis]|nr:hypothetical protein B1no1_17690 [Thermolongibacillus altinsuensis]
MSLLLKMNMFDCILPKMDIPIHYEDKKYDYSTKRYSNILKNVKINLDALAKGGNKTWNK